MSSDVILREPGGAIAEVKGGLPLVGSMDAVKTSLLDMVNGLTVGDNPKLDAMLANASDRLNEMTGVGGTLAAEPELLIATVKMLNEVRLKSMDIKRKCLDSALKAHQILESKASLTLALTTGSSSPLIPEMPAPVFEGADSTSGSSFTKILDPAPLL